MKAYFYPTYVKIEGVSEDTEATEKIRKYYAVYDKYRFTYSFMASILNEDEDTLILPGGISIGTVKYYYPYIKIIYKDDEFDEYTTVNKYALLKKPRNEIQEKAIKFLKRPLAQKYLALQTGQGKSYCAVHYCWYSKKLPIVIMDQETLCAQWVERIMEYTSCREKDIYIISGKPSVKKLYDMDEKERKKIKFIIALYQTLNVLYNEGNLSDFFRDMKIGLKIYDEAHLFYKSIFLINTTCNIETIYLSATPGRVPINEQKLYEKMFYDVPIHKTNITHKYYNICLVNIDMGFKQLEIANFYNKRGFDLNVYNKALMEEDHIDDFKEVLYDVLNKVFVKKFNRKKKVIILVKLIEQCDTVKLFIDDFLDEDAENKGYDRVLTTGVLNGKTPKKEKNDIKNNCDIIVSTDKSCAKGLDVLNLEILINFVPVSASQGTNNINQITGRLRELPNKKVFYVDVIDTSVPQLVSMSKPRIRYYKTIAKKIYKMKGYSSNHSMNKRLKDKYLKEDAEEDE